jgi:NADH-quinone oxidoreductase subunit L
MFTFKRIQRYGRTKVIYMSPALITFPLIVLAILATLGGLMVYQQQQLVEQILSAFIYKVAEEHHFGTSEYLLMVSNQGD